MKSENTAKTCYLCKKPLSFWSTSGKKYQGHKICSSCGLGLVKTKFKADMTEISRKAKIAEDKRKAQEVHQTKTVDLATKINRMGVKLTVHLTLPIVLILVGIFTFPIGILFWIFAIVLFAGLFGSKK